jgi:hypothetical protein
VSPARRKTARAVLVAVAGLAVVVAAVALLAGGCDERPRAPALVPESVYENPDVGLTFLVPEGWITTRRSSAPVTTLFDKPHPLVRYQTPLGETAGTLELYAIDLPGGTDLIAYLSEGRNQIGSERWAAKAAPTPDTINGTPCTRYALSEVKKANRRRDLVAFDRGNGRIYVFILTYTAGASARQQGGRAIDSARWK